MGPVVILLFLCYIGSKVSADVSINTDFDEKLRQTKVEMAKLYFQEAPPVRLKTYKVQWDKLWENPVGKERPFLTGNIFNRTFILDGNHFIALSTDMPFSNETSLKEVALIHRDNAIKFVRNTVWKAVLYLLVCYETGSCSLYTGTDNSKLRHRQTMQHLGFPVDASFFTRTNQLYLVVADNSGQFTVPSLIYQWRGTYMDIVKEVMTTAAVSVATFKHKQSIIIIFAQNDKHLPMGSLVYEFKENSLDRIQFLSTLRPVSVKHYTHGGYSFIFLMNDLGPSNIFWWDGRELLNWLQLSDIGSSSLIQIVNIDGNTFFFVGHDNVLQLYKFENVSDYTLVDSKKLKDQECVIDMHVQIYESSVIVVLITKNEDNVYNIELWELHVKEIPSKDSTRETEYPFKCLSELIEIIQQRKSVVEKAESSWPLLLSATENVTIVEPIALTNIILESGTIGNVEEIAGHGKLERDIENLSGEIDDVLLNSKKILVTNSNNTLTGDVIVDGEAFFEELEIDSMQVDFLNDVEVQADGVIFSKDTQEFETPLHGKRIVAHDVEVDSLCGISKQHWTLKNNTSRMMLTVDSDKIEFSKDTLILHSNVSLSNLNTKMLNNINIDEFYKDLFKVGFNQKINGNITFKNMVQMSNLTVYTLNEELFENFLTKTTEQSFDNFFMKHLRIDHLYADSINGVPVSEAARISRENVIQGQVNIANLHITKELIVNPDFESNEPKTLQIYQNVTVLGNVRIKTINLKKTAKIFLNTEEFQLDKMFETFWTKSSDQVIRDKIAFEGDLVIDRLDAKYLNGFSNDDFLYTTVEEIPETFTNLHFENVHVSDTFFVSGEDTNLFEVATESLTIHKPLHVNRFHANNLLVDTFNGIRVHDILAGTQPANFSNDTTFSTLRAKHVKVDEFNFLSLNGKNISSLLQGETTADRIMTSDYAKFSKFHAEDLIADRINNLEMNNLKSLWNINVANLKNLTIDGNLTVQNDLKIKQIDNQTIEIYLQNIAEGDIELSSQIIDELVVQNLTLNLLNGYNLDTLFECILSKSKEQVIPGQFSFYKITTINFETRIINGQEASNLMWTDEPLTLTGNVTFTDLFVEGDVKTSTINGHDFTEFYKTASDESTTRVIDLKVYGDVSWETPSQNPASLSSLFKNAVSKNTDQIIHGATVFETDVSISDMTGEFQEIDEIRKIVSDAVIDDVEIINVTGKKTFKQDLSVNTLSVLKDTGIQIINDVNIIEFNKSAIRKYEPDIITGTITFLKDVKVGEMLVQSELHGVPMSSLALATDTLHHDITFEHLVVLNSLSVEYLDGIDLDRFVEDHITVNKDHEILLETQFKSDVEVKELAQVTKINGIHPSELIVNGLEETQFISGMKTFESDLLVNGNVNTRLINNLDILSEYTNGIQNDENVEIYGDLIFESNVKLPENVIVSGLVNGVNFSTVSDELQEYTYKTLRSLKENETIVEEKMINASKIAQTLQNIFAYFEEQDKLIIQVPNVKKVDIVEFESTVKLNMFAEEPGHVCGLPEHCFCPSEYVAELTNDYCKVNKTNGSTIIRNFHELNNAFGINVVTNTVSSSRECTSNETSNEFTTISWVSSGVTETGKVGVVFTEAADKIRGFLKDAQVFMHNNEAYIILAMYYDTSRETHRTNSLVYKIDFAKDTLLSHQEIPTEGAWDIQLFKTSYHSGTHLLIGCFGDTAESVLYRQDIITSRFVLLQNFSGKTRHVKSLSQEKNHFVLLDDFHTNAVNIFNYNPKLDRFDSYQSLFHDSRVNGIECFYAGDFGQSDSFVIVTTEDGQFYVYEYMFAQKFRVIVRDQVYDLQTMLPFYYLGSRYVFAGASVNSTVLRIVQQGPY